ncbi:MAG: hypothetical protein AVDCRST_MAG02-3908, partial [uncultured Rubrobacteraceae bacterium]
ERDAGSKGRGNGTPRRRETRQGAVLRYSADGVRGPDVGSGGGRAAPSSLGDAEGVGDVGVSRGGGGGVLGLRRPSRAGGVPALPGKPGPAQALRGAQM